MALKDQLNTLIHTEILGRTGEPIDYLKDAQSLRDVVTRLQNQGWTIDPNWQTERVLTLERQSVRRLTREDGSTYESPLIERKKIAIDAELDLDGGGKITPTRIEAFAYLLLSAHRRVRDKDHVRNA